MKALVLLLGLTTATLLSGVVAVTVRIKAYSATGELDFTMPEHNTFTLGTRVLLICNLTLEGNEVLSYSWYHNCTGSLTSECEIQDRDPYYRVLNDTLLVEVTSWDQGGRYYCTVHNLQEANQPFAVTPNISVAGNPVPFLYTPTSLLPEHSVLTDVQQATGQNGQQWITCRSGGQGPGPEIQMGSNEVALSSSTTNSATIGLGSQLPNGLYHCLSAQSQRHYFSLFIRNSVTLPTPTTSGQNTTVWTLTSPDGSQVERYIVEFECSVGNITFVEKYMSVSVSGGTGQVATSVSCFGGLGQLYRVKVWAVSGPSISRALVCTPDGQCTEEELDDDRGTPISPTTVLTPPGNTDKLSPTPSGPQHPNMQPNGTFIAVGVGVGVFLLFVMLIMVVIILVAVVVRRKAAYKQKRDATMGDNPHCSNTVVAEQEMEQKEKGVGVYEDVDEDNGEERGSIADGFDPYEVVDREVHIKKAKKPASVTSVPAVYATVDNSKKKRTKMETEDGCTATNNDQYAMPMRKMGKTTDIGEGVVGSGGMEEGEQYDDIVMPTYEPMADSESGQQNEGGSN